MLRRVRPDRLLAVLAACAGLAAGASGPVTGLPALRFREPTDTVEVVAERARVTVAGRAVATAQKGRWFGVRKRQDDRVAVQVVVGTSIRTGWMRTADVRVVKGKEVDLVGEALRLARALKPTLDVGAYKARAEAIAARVAAAARAAATPIERARAVSRQLFVRERFGYQRSEQLLDEILDTKRGNCLGLSLLYLCSTTDLELPIYMVAVPGHAFLRYDDGRQRFNIEPSYHGILFRGAPPALRRGRALGGVHLRLLARPQVVGLIVSQFGAALAREGKYAEACGQFARAVEICPEIAEAYCDWGTALANLKKLPPACDKFSRAVQAHPRFAKAYSNWGIALANMGERAWACKKFTLAVEADPRFAAAYFNWGIVLIAMDRTDEGIAKLHKSVELDPRYAAKVEQALRTVPASPPKHRDWVPLPPLR